MMNAETQVVQEAGLGLVIDLVELFISWNLPLVTRPRLTIND